jgi:hypothetical protein
VDRRGRHVVLLLVLLVGYVAIGAAQAGAASDRADAALKQVQSHQQSVQGVLTEDIFQGVGNLAGRNPDLQGAQTAVASFEPRVPSAMALVRSDQKTLQDVRSRLDGSFFTLAQSGGISRERRRVDAALSALASAQRALGMLQKEVAFMKPFFAGLVGLYAVGQAMQNRDAAGALAQLPETQDGFNKAAELARPPAIPSALTSAVKDLQAMANDAQRLVSAVQASDQAGADQAVVAIAADQKLLNDVDYTAIDQSVVKLFKPLQDNYDKEMKIAATG